MAPKSTNKRSERYYEEEDDQPVDVQEDEEAEYIRKKKSTDDLKDIELGRDQGNDGQEAEKKVSDSLFKLNGFEKKMFGIVHGLVKDRETNFVLMTLFVILQDLQLFAFSFRSDLVATSIVRWVFDPLLAFVDLASLPAFITFWVALAVLLTAFIYSAVSLSSGQVRVMFPVHITRFLTALTTSVLFTPMLFVFLNPTKCASGGSLTGYAGIACNSEGHLALFAVGIIGAAFVSIYTVFMSLVFYDGLPNARAGKRHGRVDLFYLLVRIAMVVIEIHLEPLASSIVNTLLIVALTGFFIHEQPFFHPILNNLRAAFLIGASALALSSLGYVIIGMASPVGYIGAGLGVAAVFFLAGYFINAAFVKARVRKVLEKLKNYDLVVREAMRTSKPPPVQNMDAVRQSYADLLYANPDDVTRREAIAEKVNVFPGPQWVEITARFIRTSYMDQESVTIANRLLEVGTLQYPDSPLVYLSYMNYIKCFLTILRGKERSHMNMMLRKCRLNFDERFLTYLQQQFVRQLEEMRRAGEDGDVQFTSFIEYQSLENSAKNYHVEALTQLRDFWNAVRSDAPPAALVVRLGRIGELAHKCSGVYKKLVTRFPNSRNMLLLYSRFFATIVADGEQATQYRTMADDLEQDQADNEALQAATGGDDAEKKSAAHSRGSSTDSREARIIRQKRVLLRSRLDLPVNEFMKRANWTSAFFLLILILATAISKSAVDGTATSLDKLDTVMIGRRLMHKIYSDVRRLVYSAQRGESSDFVAYADSLTKSKKDWRANVETYYNSHVLDPAKSILYFWNPTTQSYSTQRINAYTAQTYLVMSMFNTLNYMDKNFTKVEQLLSNATVNSNDRNLRFVFDNLDGVYGLLDQDCLKVANDYGNFVSTEILAIGFLYGALGLLLIIGGFIIPFIYLSGCNKVQDQILGLFRKVPRNLVLNFITELEEEIEIISDGVEKLGNLKTNVGDIDKGRGLSRLTLKWQYMVLLLLVLAGVPGMFYVVYAHLSATQWVPLVYQYSNVRRTDLTQRIYAMAQETIANDTTYWVPQMAVAQMAEAVSHMERLHAFVNTNLEPFLQDPSSMLYRALRSGDCWKKPSSLCNSTAIPDIGYTTEFMTSGLDTQIVAYFAKSREWIASGNYGAQGLKNPIIRLLEIVSFDLRTTYFEVIKNAIVSVVVASINGTSVYLFGQLGAVLALVLIAYFVGFFTTSRSLYKNNAQLISLLFYVPAAERAKITDLHAFIESGGAILN